MLMVMVRLIGDYAYLGNSLPKFTYGLTVNLNYKNFDLMVFGQGQGGNKIFQGLRRLDIPDSNYQTAALGRWHGEEHLIHMPD